MKENISILTKLLREDPLTTWIGIIWVVSSFIVGNPASIAFVGPAASALVVSLATFINQISGPIGLFFAADAKLKMKRMENENEEEEKALKKKPIKKPKV